MGHVRKNDGRCDHCNIPGERYTYRGIEFDGLTAYEGERLCKRCTDRQLAIDAPEVMVTPIAYARERFGIRS